MMTSVPPATILLAANFRLSKGIDVKHSNCPTCTCAGAMWYGYKPSADRRQRGKGTCGVGKCSNRACVIQVMQNRRIYLCSTCASEKGWAGKLEVGDLPGATAAPNTLTWSTYTAKLDNRPGRQCSKTFCGDSPVAVATTEHNVRRFYCGQHARERGWDGAFEQSTEEGAQA